MFSPTEEVTGEIVGGGFCRWQLFYADRPQSSATVARTEESAIAAAKIVIALLTAQYGTYPVNLFPEPEKWEIRLWQTS